jgi:hypothetical protein
MLVQETRPGYRTRGPGRAGSFGCRSLVREGLGCLPVAEPRTAQAINLGVFVYIFLLFFYIKKLDGLKNEKIKIFFMRFSASRFWDHPVFISFKN